MLINVISKVVYEGKDSEVLDYIDLRDMISFRSILWKILEFLDFVMKELESALGAILDFSVELPDEVTKIVELSWNLLPVVLIVLIFIKTLIPKSLSDIYERVMILVLLMTLFNLFDTFTTKVIDIGKNEFSQSYGSTEIFKLVDVKKTVEDNKVTYVDSTTKDIWSIDVNSSTGDKPLQHAIDYRDTTGTIAYGHKLDTAWVKLDEEIYLYNFDFVVPFFMAIGKIIFYVFISMKLVSNMLEVLMLKTYGTFIVVTKGGARANILFTSFITIASLYVLLQGSIVVFEAVWSGAFALMNSNPVAAILIIFGSGLFLINGSEYLKRIISDDVGTKSFLSQYLGAKAVAGIANTIKDGVGKVTDGISGVSDMSLESSDNNSNNENKLNEYMDESTTSENIGNSDNNMPNENSGDSESNDNNMSNENSGSFSGSPESNNSNTVTENENSMNDSLDSNNDYDSQVATVFNRRQDNSIEPNIDKYMKSKNEEEM